MMISRSLPHLTSVILADGIFLVNVTLNFEIKGMFLTTINVYAYFI